MTIFMRGHSTTLIAACSLLLGATGCSSCSDEEESAAVGAASTSAEASRPPSPRASDPAWTEARGPVDPLVLGALAEREGALGLVEGVLDGGEVRQVALRALRHAADAELALGTLGELSASASDGEREALLSAVVDVAGRPREPRELLDPEGVRACAAHMVELSQREGLPAKQRALAVTAARRLGEKGYVTAEALRALPE